MKSYVLKSNEAIKKEKFNKEVVVILFWVLAFATCGTLAYERAFKSFIKDKTLIEAEKTKAHIKKVEARLVKLKKYLKADYDAYAREIGMNGLDACFQYNSNDKDICLMIYNEVN